jgi:hypothetical protein
MSESVSKWTYTLYTLVIYLNQLYLLFMILN